MCEIMALVKDAVQISSSTRCKASCSRARQGGLNPVFYCTMANLTGSGREDPERPSEMLSVDAPPSENALTAAVHEHLAVISVVQPTSHRLISQSDCGRQTLLLVCLWPLQRAAQKLPTVFPRRLLDVLVGSSSSARWNMLLTSRVLWTPRVTRGGWLGIHAACAGLRGTRRWLLTFYHWKVPSTPRPMDDDYIFVPYGGQGFITVRDPPTPRARQLAYGGQGLITDRAYEAPDADEPNVPELEHFMAQGLYRAILDIPWRKTTASLAAAQELPSNSLRLRSEDMLCEDLEECEGLAAESLSRHPAHRPRHPPRAWNLFSGMIYVDRNRRLCCSHRAKYSESVVVSETMATRPQARYRETYLRRSRSYDFAQRLARPFVRVCAGSRTQSLRDAVSNRMSRPRKNSAVSLSTKV
ncbi:hypothetical protein C8F01DRAFT_1085824 [Mycena amicta]|nr:hypothetical protein C8F01DRAFT_1085824 [Mycena amicta]